jgi:hypothetical protein
LPTGSGSRFVAKSRFTRLDPQKIAAGAALYQTHGQACHLPRREELLNDLRRANSETAHLPKYWWRSGAQAWYLKVTDVRNRNGRNRPEAPITRDRRIEGMPLFDGVFTDVGKNRGRLGLLNRDVEIGLTETVPSATRAQDRWVTRRKGPHKAILCITRGGCPGLCLSNADFFLEPFGPPVLQVSSEYAAWLGDCAG